MNSDDVGMADAGHQPAFFDDFIGGRRIRIAVPQQFERDVAIEVRIPGAINVAEAPAAYAVEDLQMAPVGGSGGVLRTRSVRR